MSAEVDFIQAEIGEVQSMVEVECWLEGERRHQAVEPSDAVVQQRVAEIILSGAGAALRNRIVPHSIS